MNAWNQVYVKYHNGLLIHNLLVVYPIYYQHKYGMRVNFLLEMGASEITSFYECTNFRVGFHLEWNHPNPKVLCIDVFSGGFSLGVKSSKAESFMNTFLFGWVFT